MLRPNFRFYRTFVWLLLCFALSACVPNPFEFTEPGTARLVTDERFNNPVLSQAGIIEYSSSNTDVATVDANGLVVALAPGQSQITATQTLGERIQSIDYSVEVITRQASLSAWVGPLGSELQLSDGTEGVNLFTTSAANCNPIQFANCANSQSQRLRGGVQRSTSSAAVTLSQPGYVRLQHGEHEWSGMLSADRFVGRQDHAVAAFQGRLWVMGGGRHQFPGDIWSSSDGTHWVQHEWSEQPPFGARIHAVVFNDQLWVIDPDKGTVWSTIPSPDHDTGFVWQRQGDISPGYTPRSYSPVIVANNAEGEPRIWLLGGGIGSAARNDVWTFDGTTWQAVRTDGASNGFPARGAHQAVAYDGRLWVIGGNTAKSPANNDIWSSDDGITWRPDTEHAEFSARIHHRVMAYNDGSGEQLWLVGGQTLFGHKNDVWSSRDGIHWTQRQVDADFPPRNNHALAVFQQQLWLVGGFANNDLNDVWSTQNGEDWQQRTAEAPFSGRQGHQTVVFDHRLWVIGGNEGGTNLPSYQNDLWSSSDGLHWQRHLRHAAFTGRSGHQVVAFNQRLWLVGGQDRYGYQSDVWSSADGLHWERLLTQAPFAGRRGHALVVFDQRLWVIGGQSADGNHNDVWSSPNGIDWTEETSAASFTARQGHQVVVFNGQLWLIGGSEAGFDSNGGNNDIWSSSDGRHWQLRVDAADFAPRFGHQVMVTQEAGSERLWLVYGGNGGSIQNDIWTSRDGVHWYSELKDYDTRFSARTGHQALVFNQDFWVIGGVEARGTNTLKHDIWRSADGLSWQKGLQVDVEFQ
ncbi:kelch repeat-containing protein [Saccharospirillum mangrovi]|uniref:Kelch repeat-containing protein n=1 Tax=Saccharospirillum mangrovi TaxID=2161747 RepID=UPI000D3CE473|nr:kelch repeat-containing protein [Saccharospirillum mangrovi]